MAGTSSSKSTIVWVDQLAEVETTLELINKESRIALDCEGYNLGKILPFCQPKGGLGVVLLLRRFTSTVGLIEIGESYAFTLKIKGLRPHNNLLIYRTRRDTGYHRYCYT